MAHTIISIGGKPLGPHRAVVSPDWKAEKVLTSDLWTYVDLWIRRNAKNTDARFYWQQARNFYRASQGLPATASPLALYYCFLNATKALLAAKKLTYSDQHGLSGRSILGKASLSNEEVKLKGAGVLPALILYYGDSSTGTYKLKDLLHNMAFIHRAFCLSYKVSYLFFSALSPRYVRAIGSSEAWVSMEFEERFGNKKILSTLPPNFNRDIGFPDSIIIRKEKKRFRWRSGRGTESANISNLTRYHQAIRRDLTYIAGADRWYLKRRHSSATLIDRHTPTLIFAAMHRLSELSRYQPLRLARMLETERSWVLAEFINTAPNQFLDEISCELTGQEICVPDIHVGSSLTL